MSINKVDDEAISPLKTPENKKENHDQLNRRITNVAQSSIGNTSDVSTNRNRPDVTSLEPKSDETNQTTVEGTSPDDYLVAEPVEIVYPSEDFDPSKENVFFASLPTRVAVPQEDPPKRVTEEQLKKVREELHEKFSSTESFHVTNQDMPTRKEGSSVDLEELKKQISAEKEKAEKKPE